MNKKTIEIQENDLHAYVDNQLSAEKVKAVEALMRKNPNIAQQVSEWQQQNAAITQLFDTEEFSKIPEQLNVKHINENLNIDKKTTRKSTPWLYSLAASLFLMVISGSAGWFAHDLSQPMTKNTKNFVNSAISAHQVYTVEVIHPVEVSADKETHLVAWLSKRIDHPLTIPKLHEYGYTLLGGRLLPMREGRPAAQFMFENTEGERVTLLISKNPSFRDQSFKLKSNNKVSAFYWMDTNIAYSVTGEMSPDSLRKLSTAIYHQLNENNKAKQVVAL